MNNKAKILHAIQQNKPALTALPDIPTFYNENLEVITFFQKMVEIGGGKAILCANEKLEDIIVQLFPTAYQIASTVKECAGNVDLYTIQSPHELENIDVAVIPSQLGVAENGAVWITEQDCVHRVLPFITQHLVVLLNKNTIVQNLHDAYRKIKMEETGYGLWIAGPSKTADIEQSLVIGAQGARSFTVLLH